jgi:hypothetical protein
LINNKYDASTLNKINSRRKEKKEEKDNQNGKCAKFTYVGKETGIITKLFKNTNVKIAFTTDNTTERILPTLHKQVQYKYDKCGI